MPRKAPRPYPGNGTQGQPTDYHPDYAPLVYKLFESGKVATMKELAEHLNIRKALLLHWRQRYPEFFKALRDGRYDYDTKQVVKSLHQKATGYEYTETTIEGIVIVEEGQKKLHIEKKVAGTGKGSGKATKTRLVPGFKQKTVTKRVAPDTMAMMFWLQNRQPDEWKNVQKQIVEGHVDHKHDHRVELDLRKLGRPKLEQLRQLVMEAEVEKEETLPATEESAA